MRMSCNMKGMFSQKSKPAPPACLTSSVREVRWAYFFPFKLDREPSFGTATRMAEERCTNHTSVSFPTKTLHAHLIIFFFWHIFGFKVNQTLSWRRGKWKVKHHRGPAETLGHKDYQSTTACQKADKWSLPAVAHCALVVPLVACEAPLIHQCRPVKEAWTEIVTYVACLYNCQSDLPNEDQRNLRPFQTCS